MESVISILAFPAALVIVGVVAIFAFRAPITRMIDRAIRLKYGSGAVDLGGSASSVEEKQRNADDAVDNPVVPNIPTAQAIPPPEELYQGIETEIRDTLAPLPPESKLAWAIRALAGVRVMLGHEKTYRLLVGSQLSLLLQANASPMIEVSAARTIYDNAAQQYPDLYPKFGFDTWVNYPVNAGLLAQGTDHNMNSVLRITILGRDFLHYLIAANLTGPKYG